MWKTWHNNKHKRNKKKGGKKVEAKSHVSTNKPAVKATTTQATYWSRKKECHIDPMQVIPNLWIGSSWAEEDILKHCNVVVPLNNLDGSVWNNSWNGDIVYVPITDYRALPLHILKKYSEQVALMILANYSVGIFCMGGHGRTGYFTSAVLWQLGIPQKEGFSDPVDFLRTRYCQKAVESHAQLESLEALTGLSLVGKYPEKLVTYGTYYSSFKDKSDKVVGFKGQADKVQADHYTSMWDEFYDPYVYDSVDKQETLVEDVEQDPCYACIESDEIVTSDNKLKLECAMGHMVGKRCDWFLDYTGPAKEPLVMEEQESLGWKKYPLVAK